ncbi:syntaxin binding protein 1 [Coemansia sp. Benny D115]|nr:syntaxin binding protein 1 [Coemansia sp. Benny D115]
MDAIYILVPCADSVERMIDDFKPRPQNAESESQKASYAHAHLFFTGELPDELLSLIASSPAAPYVKNVTEMFIEYNPIESRVFLTTPSEQPFYTLYSPHSTDKIVKDLDAASDRIISVISSLKIRPYIRFYSPGEPTDTEWNGIPNKDSYPRIAQAMAVRLQMKLDEFYAHEERKPIDEKMDDQTYPPPVIIVLDRSIDMYAPLIHEATYQAMVYDLVDLGNGDKYTYQVTSNDGNVSQIEAELCEKTDELWRSLRHEHIVTVADTLADRVDKLLSDHAGIKALNKPIKLHEMKAAISEMPEFQHLQSLYSLHSHLASECLRISKERNLPMIIDLERELVTQLSTSGEHVGRMSLETRLIALLDDQSLDDSDRIRLLFLYLIYVNGGKAQDRRRLEEVPQCLSINDKRAAVNLCRLGIPTNRTHHVSGSSKHSSGKYKWKKSTGSSPENNESWFEPAVKQIVKSHLSDDLSETMFPWTEAKPTKAVPKNMLNTAATSLRR